MRLDLQINNQSHYPVNPERLGGAVESVLKKQPGDKFTVSILVAGKEEMARLNWQYHQTQGPTDVLSFPYTDPQSLPDEGVDFVTPPEAGIVLGDIVVCYEVAEEIAVKEGKTVDEVVEFYVLHGLEHLLGHHHD